MVHVIPFRGLRYSREIDPGSVTAPPYDVIDPAQQDRLYKRHAANIVRLILNRKTDQDTDQHSVYTRAASFLTHWETQGILQPEAQPAVYAYSQTWDGITRRGAIMLLRLEQLDSGKVLPHERTLRGPKEDRLKLMRATECNLSQIFMIYQDPNRTLETLLFPAEEVQDWAEATDEAGVIHRMRPVFDADVLRQCRELFADKPLLIADGHHRYETALGFQKEVRERIRRETGHEPPPGHLLSDYVMVFVTNLEDPGLKVYPTHRVIGAFPEGWDRNRFEAELFNRFEKADQPVEAGFTYQVPGGRPVHLRVKPEYVPDLHPLLKHYDAALLEEVVFKGILGRTGEQLKQAHHLDFIREEGVIDTLLQQGKTEVVFWLQAPSVPQVMAICRAGERMPQKSTYFYPKILSGLVLYPYRPFVDGSGHALTGAVTDVRPVIGLEATCQ